MSDSWNDAPVLGVEAPPHEGALDPLLEPEQIVVAEAKPSPDRVAAGQVEHLGRRDTGGGQLEHLGQDAQHGVGLPQRSVGQANLEGTGWILGAPSPSPLRSWPPNVA